MKIHQIKIRRELYKIIYKLSSSQFSEGINEDYCILGIKEIYYEY